MRASLIAVLVIAVGCVRVQVTIDVEPSGDFERYASYAQNASAQAPEVIDSVQREIDSIMQAKGYQTLGIENADLVLSFDINRESTRRRQLSSDPDANYYRVTNHIEDTLVIEVLDRDSQSVVWRGVGKVDIDRDRDAPRVAAIATRKVLATFPLHAPADGEKRATDAAPSDD